MSWNGSDNGNKNGDSSSSSSDRRILTDQQELRRHQVRVLENCMRLIRTRMETSQTIQDMAKNGSYRTAPDYAAERQVLMQVNNLGLAEGLIAGAVTFLTLRRGPAILTRWLVRRQAQRTQGSYKLDAPPSPFTATSSKQQQGIPTSEPAAPQRMLFPLRVLRFTLDVIVSVTVAATTSLYFTNQDDMLSQVASIPLVEGRSLISDEFCHDIVAEFQREPREFWNSSQNSLPLQTIQTFAKNCMLRAAQEEKLRKEQGLAPNEPVKIPPPGVVDTSSNYYDNHAIMMEDGAFDNNKVSSSTPDPLFGEFGDDSKRSDVYFGEEEKKDNSDDWASSFVTDREEDAKRGRRGGS